jgi:hypothetical protein
LCWKNGQNCLTYITLPNKAKLTKPIGQIWQRVWAVSFPGPRQDFGLVVDFMKQRAILNFTLDPRGKIRPLGGLLTPSFTPWGEHSLLFRWMEGRTENFTPRGQNSPLGDNFAPEVKVCPLGRS